MNKQANSATKHPLKGMRVLVGRARHQAGALSAELRKLGASVIDIPFIEIRKPRSFRPLDSALKNLNNYDWLILTSVNGVEAMWNRMAKLHRAKALAKVTNSETSSTNRKGPEFTRAARSGRKTAASASEGRVRVAAIGPATRKAIERRGLKVDLVPREYVAESVVRSMKAKVKGKRVLLVRAKVARDVIPRELRRAGAQVDVVEAYETVVPKASRRRLQAAMRNPKRRPQVVTFTSSSTVKNFAALLGPKQLSSLKGVRMSSIGPVTSATLREYKLPVDISAKEFTIPGLVAAIVEAFHSR